MNQFDYNTHAHQMKPGKQQSDHLKHKMIVQLDTNTFKYINKNIKHKEH